MDELVQRVLLIHVPIFAEYKLADVMRKLAQEGFKSIKNWRYLAIMSWKWQSGYRCTSQKLNLDVYSRRAPVKNRKQWKYGSHSLGPTMEDKYIFAMIEKSHKPIVCIRNLSSGALVHHEVFNFHLPLLLNAAPAVLLEFAYLFFIRTFMFSTEPLFLN